MKYTCPCCGYKTLDEEPPGTYDICEICFWEDDGYQYEHPDEDGANYVEKHNKISKKLGLKVKEVYIL